MTPLIRSSCPPRRRTGLPRTRQARRLAGRCRSLPSPLRSPSVGWCRSRPAVLARRDPDAPRSSGSPSWRLSVSLRLDGFGLLMGLLVSGIGVLVLLYSTAYFGRRDDLGRLAGLLVGFAGAMLGHRVGRRPAHPVRVLGAHLDHVVPADRVRRPLRHGPGRGRARLPGHRGRRSLPARRPHHPRADHRDTTTISELRRRPALGNAGRPSPWCWCCWARSPSRPSSRSTSGCPGPWPPRRP